MGNQLSSMNKVSFEDVQWFIKEKKTFLLINTLKTNNQACLISGTCAIQSRRGS